MPTPPDILDVPCQSILGRIGTNTVYSRNRYATFAYHTVQPFHQPSPPTWDMWWPSNQIAALFATLSPAELATWLKPARRARLPVRTFFNSVNMKRCHGRNAYMSRVTRTYKAS